MQGVDITIVRAALNELPAGCRYHGTDFDRLGTEGWAEPHERGLPRCDSCKPAWRRAQGLDALDRIQNHLARLNSVPELRRNT